MLYVKKTSAKIIVWILLIIFSLFNLYPFIYMLMMSFKTNDEIMKTNPFGLPKNINFDNYKNAWQKFNIPIYFRNSIIVTFSAVTCTVFLALLVSYVTSRTHWKYSNHVRAYISLGMFIPMQIVLIPLVVIAKKWHFSNSLLTLIIPYTAFELSFACLIIHGFMRQIPKEFEEAAYLDGAGIIQTFFKIICPMLIPAISASYLYAFIGVWNEFSVALVMIQKEAMKTLPLGMINFRSQNFTDWGGMGASMIMASLPAVILYAILGDKLEKALAVGAGIKG